MVIGDAQVPHPLAGVGLVLLVMVSMPPGAAAERPTYQELEERVRRLEQIIRDHGLDKPPPPAPAPVPEAKPAAPAEIEQIVEQKLKQQKPLAGWKDGFFLESPDGSYKLKFRGYYQVQGRFPFGKGTDATNSSFFLRRVRPILEGTVAKWFDFKVMPDFGQGNVTIEDAYMDVTYLGPELKLRGGKMKVPLSLERLQSGEYLLFIERSIANQLTPNRDVGFYLFGDLWDGRIAYQVGAFDGSLDGATNNGDVNDGKELAARVFAHPLRAMGVPYLDGLGIGVGSTYGNDDDGENLSGFSYRTPERVVFFSYLTSDDIAAEVTDVRTRVDPQAYYFWGPLSLMSEYIWESQGVVQTNDSTGAVRSATFDNSSWMAQATYVLTGEDASYKGVVPRHAFDPRQGHWGAFEIGLRGSKIFLDDDIFTLGFADAAVSASRAAQITAGVNWYFNRNFKFMVNYNWTDFDRPIEINDQRFRGVQSFLMQMQLSY